MKSGLWQGTYNNSFQVNVFGINVEVGGIPFEDAFYNPSNNQTSQLQSLISYAQFSTVDPPLYYPNGCPNNIFLLCSQFDPEQITNNWLWETQVADFFLQRSCEVPQPLPPIELIRLLIPCCYSDNSPIIYI